MVVSRSPAKKGGGGESRNCDGNAQFLEVAVVDIMAAPVRYGIELDAVGELHAGYQASSESADSWRWSYDNAGFLSIMVGICIDVPDDWILSSANGSCADPRIRVQTSLMASCSDDACGGRA